MFYVGFVVLYCVVNLVFDVWEVSLRFMVVGVFRSEVFESL